MRQQVIFAIIACVLALPVLAHETGEPHTEFCPAEEFEATGRGCPFPSSSESPQTLREWLITDFQPGYEATTASWWVAGVLSALVLGIAAWRWQKLPKKKRKTLLWLKTAGGILVVLAFTYVAYSTYVYWYSGIAVSGLELCDESGCRISVHWHAALEEMRACDEIVERPWETGDLEGPHTHKDNSIHMHTVLEINPATKELLDPYPMTLGGFFDAIFWKFNETCLAGTCDACNGNPATTKVWKNGEPVTGNIRDTMWKDGDTFIIRFE